MSHKLLLHLRITEELSAAIEEVVAQSPSGNRSEVVRALLWQALRGEPERAAVLQALYDATGVRKIFFARLRDEMAERAPAILDEVLTRAAAEAAE